MIMSSITTDFDRLVYKTLAMGGRKTFLIVFLNMKHVHGGQIIIRTTGNVGCETVAKGLNFHLFNKQLKEHALDWELLTIEIADVGDGSPQYLELCQRELERMEQRIQAGDLDGQAIFNRKGMQFNGLRPQKKDFSDIVVFDAAAGLVQKHTHEQPSVTRFSAEIETVDALINELRRSEKPNTLLVSFLRLLQGREAESAGLHILAQRTYPCHDGFSFEALRKDAHESGINWDMGAIEIATSPNGTLAAGESEAMLAGMRRRIETGEAGELVVFTTEGALLEASASISPIPESDDAPRLH